MCSIKNDNTCSNNVDKFSCCLEQKRSNAVDGVSHIVNMNIYFHSLAKNNLF